ncbi:regulatory protein [Actinopolyspora mzabensis]|uniref:Regulatory protein RecX n=1 Tax=Actinopolyspora mzabensis TaxID=995066 RepID=A0A1G9BKW1_ACTMZ|nr:regulatory protein RecX [Actinopolyspora mzabensis]SDK40087.1 regulatory protein [Actinopolyspora mzabensis]
MTETEAVAGETVPCPDEISTSGPTSSAEISEADSDDPAVDSDDPAVDSDEPAGNSGAERTARETVYRLLAIRARSRAELLRALLRGGVDPETAELVLDKFAAAGLVDDAAFAAEWVRGRHRHGGLGRGAIREELREKGIDEETAAEALHEVDTDAEVERARELVRRKARGMTGVESRAKMRRLLGMLARKGYGQALAFRVVREELEAAEPETSFSDDESLFAPEE